MGRLGSRNHTCNNSICAGQKELAGKEAQGSQPATLLWSGAGFILFCGL
jgi:hypothetical protein